MRITLVSIIIIIMIGCSDHELTPTRGQKAAILLAGVNGKSKTWSIAGGNVATPDGSFTLTFPDCFKDSRFTFSNNQEQSYEITEGSSRCNVDDPILAENGVWAFAEDGRTVLISALRVYSDWGLFGFLTEPAEVLELTNDTFNIIIRTVDGDGVKIEFRFYFVRV